MDFKSLRKEIISKNASITELVNEFFLNIESKDHKINSYTFITKDIAIAQAHSN